MLRINIWKYDKLQKQLKEYKDNIHNYKMTEEELERSVKNNENSIFYKDALEDTLKIYGFNLLDICKFVRLQDKNKYDVKYGLHRLNKDDAKEAALLICDNYKQLLYNYIKRIDFQIFHFKYFQFGLFGDVDIGVILKDCKEDIEAQHYYKKEIEETISSYKRKCYIKKLETNNTVLHKNNITILNTQFFYSNFN